MTGCMPVLARSTTCFLKVATSKPFPVSFGKFVIYRQLLLTKLLVAIQKSGDGGPDAWFEHSLVGGTVAIEMIVE